MKVPGKTPNMYAYSLCDIHKRKTTQHISEGKINILSCPFWKIMIFKINRSHPVFDAPFGRAWVSLKAKYISADEQMLSSIIKHIFCSTVIITFASQDSIVLMFRSVYIRLCWLSQNTHYSALRIVHTASSEIPKKWQNVCILWRWCNMQFVLLKLSFGFLRSCPLHFCTGQQGSKCIIMMLTA